MSAEKDIDEQRFSGIMDQSSDTVSVQPGNHRSSTNFQSIQSNEDKFIFKTFEGNSLRRAGLKDNYHVVGWAAYDNMVYILSKYTYTKLDEDLELIGKYNALQVINGKLALSVVGGVKYEIGDLIYFRPENLSEAEAENLISQSVIIDKPSVNTIVLDVNEEEIPFRLLQQGSVGDIEIIRWGEIGRLNINGPDGSLVYIPLYNHRNLGVSMLKPYSREQVLLRQENQDILRMYFTNYVNSPKVFNVRNPFFQTVYPPNVSSLTVGKTYMVLNGTVTYDGVDYTPGTDEGNIFTATASGGTSFIGFATRVIEYYPIELLDWQPDYDQGNIDYIGEKQGGQIICGTYSAVYRCIDIEGASTPWSLPTNPIYVTRLDNESPTSANSQQTFGSTQNESSGKSLLFQMSNIDQRWTKLQVALMRHVNKEITENPLIFFEEDITDSYFVVENDGNSNITAVPLDEVQALRRWFKKVMTIEGMDNRQFIGNFESQDILSSFKPSALPVTPFEYKVISNQISGNDIENGENQEYIQDSFQPGLTNLPYPHALNGHKGLKPDFFSLVGLKLDMFVWYYLTIPEGISNTLDQEALLSNGLGGLQAIERKIISGEIFQVDHEDAYIVEPDVTPGSMGYIQYAIMIKAHQSLPAQDNDNDMILGMVYEVVSGPLEVRFSSAVDFVEYTEGTLFLYTGQELNFPVNSTISNTGYKATTHYGYNDGRNSVVQEKLSSFPRSEKIRIGIQPVDKKGFKLPVRWIGDHITPSIGSSPLIEHFEAPNANDTDYLNHIGLRIGDELNPIDVSDIAHKISGFHIVIAPIKRTVKAQGLMYHTTRATNDLNPIRIGVKPTARIRDDEYRRYWLAQGVTWIDQLPAGFDRAKALWSPDVMFKNIEELNVTENDNIVINGYLEDVDYEKWLAAYAVIEDVDPVEFAFSKVPGHRYDSSTLFSQQNPRAYDLYNKFVSDFTDRDIPGTSIKIESAAKISSAISSLPHPSDPNYVYITGGYVRRLQSHHFPTSTGGIPDLNYQFRVDHRNFMFLAHEQAQYFGVRSVIDRAIAHVSIKSPEMASYGPPEQTQYVSTGHFQPVNDKIIELTEGKFYDIEIFGGQTFVSLFSQKRNDGQSGEFGLPEGTLFARALDRIISYPVESTVYPFSRTFRHAANDREAMLEPTIPESTVVDRSNFYVGEELAQIALNPSRNENALFERSWAYSLAKTDGEEFDSWRQFLVANYRTAESDLERIMAIKKSGQNLIMWHDAGVGYAPVNDRAAISDSMGGELRLGFAGISDKSYELSNRYGLSNRLSLVETDQGFMWIDRRNMALMYLQKASQPQQFSEANFITKTLKDYIGYFDPLKREDNPIVGRGIIANYYPLTNDVYFTFMNGTLVSRRSLPLETENFKTLIVNATFLKPTGFHKFPIGVGIWHENFFYSQFPYLQEVASGTTVTRRQVVKHKNRIFSVDEPAIVPGNKNTMTDVGSGFTQLHFPNDFYLYGTGTPMKYFELPYSCEITFVINKSPGSFKTFEAVKLFGNGISWTRIKWMSDTLRNAAENAGGVMRDFAIINSLPLDDKERPRGLGIEITFTFNTDNDELPVDHNGMIPQVVIRQLNTIFRILTHR